VDKFLPFYHPLHDEPGDRNNDRDFHQAEAA
jgi:hypothetical protein